MGSSLFALGIWIRAAAVGIIAFAIMRLIALGHYYATALVLTGVAVLVLIDIARVARTADRVLADFLDGMTIGSVEGPPPAGRSAGFRRLTGAIRGRAAALSSVRAASAGQADYVQALADTVAIVLLVIEPDGSVVPANRAARQFAGRAIRRLDDIAALGLTGAATLLALPAGDRTILRLANGQRMLATAARFSAGGNGRQLIALQNIETELDAVELRAWQDLVRILSHEIMNSLTPISSLAESIRPLARKLADARDGTDQTAGDIVVAVDTISRRSTGLIGFVERYRKLAALPPPVPRTIPLTDLVARLDMLIRPLFAAKSIAWDSHIDPSDLTLSADPDLLEQALINLLHNAADAAEGGAAPHVTLECRRRDDGTVAISVTDNGSGIDSEARDKIFVPFFTTKPGGTGIGLSLVRGIVTGHGGFVEIEKNRPSGTRFTIMLPNT